MAWVKVPHPKVTLKPSPPAHILDGKCKNVFCPWVTAVRIVIDAACSTFLGGASYLASSCLKTRESCDQDINLRFGEKNISHSP